ncbi:exosortase N [Chitinophagaceae bacterium MMS25-I14]
MESIAHPISGRKYKMAKSYTDYLLPLLYLVLSFYALKDYLIWSSLNFLLGILSIVMITGNRRDRHVHKGYAISAFGFCCISFLLPVTTCIYIALFCSISFYAAGHLGKTDRLSFIAAIFMSPVFQYTSDVFGFPVRLLLTKMAAGILSLADPAAKAQGNVILFHSKDFSVDPACMGLNMLATSLLCGIITIGVYERQCGKTFRWWQLGCLIVLFVLLNIASNLMRIVFLTLFKIDACTAMHESFGLICLVIYSILPSVLLVKMLLRKYGKETGTKGSNTDMQTLKPELIIHSTLILLIAISATHINHLKNLYPEKTNPVTIAGYTTLWCRPDVLKLRNNTELVYIKHIRGFYSTDHHPSICWTGSGYTFEKVTKENFSGYNVYCAILKKDNDRLYTAWWYDNGSRRTVDQWEWRMDEMKSGRRYAIVNITTTSRAQLQQSVVNALNRNTFSPAL